VSKRTKKVGPAAKYGARYGVKPKRQAAKIETMAKSKHTCPQCKAISVKRISSGIWHCRHCDHTFAGGAYHPMRKIKNIQLDDGGQKEKRAGYN